VGILWACYTFLIKQGEFMPKSVGMERIVRLHITRLPEVTENFDYPLMVSG
jgi:hypothetical protein